MLTDIVEYQDLAQNQSNSDEKAIQLHTHIPDFYQFSLQDLQNRVKEVIAKHQGAFASNFDKARYPNTKKAFDKLTASLEYIEGSNNISLGQLLYLLNDVVEQAEQDINQSVVSKVSSYLMLALTEYSPYHPFIADLQDILKDYPSNFEYLRKWEITHQAWEVEQQNQADISKAIVLVPEQPEPSFLNSTNYYLDETVQSLLVEKDKEIEERDKKIEELEARDKERLAELGRLKMLLEEKEVQSENSSYSSTNDEKGKQRKYAHKFLGKQRVAVIDSLLKFYNSAKIGDKNLIDKIIFDLCKSCNSINQIIDNNIKTILGFKATSDLKTMLQQYLNSNVSEEKTPKLMDLDYLHAIFYLYKKGDYLPSNSEALQFFLQKAEKVHKQQKKNSFEKK